MGAEYLLSEVEVWQLASRAPRHPNLLELIDVYDLSPTRLCFVSELMRSDLMREVSRARHARREEKDPTLQSQSLLPLAWVQQATSDVLAGIAHLHKLDIVHRNISAENVLLSERICRGQPPPRDLAKIGDFGFSLRLTNSTVLKDVLGTASYIAPEMCSPQVSAIPRPENAVGYGAAGQGFEVDLWALGVVLYLSAFGSNPVFGDEATWPPQQGHGLKDQPGMRQHLERKLADFSFDEAKLDTVPPVLRDLLRGLLRRDVTSRLTALEAMHHNFFTERMVEAESEDGGYGWLFQAKDAICSLLERLCKICRQCTSGRADETEERRRRRKLA